MFDYGVDVVLFEMIVVVGVNLVILYYWLIDVVLQVGDFVKIDFGVLVVGYYFDMICIFVLGKVVDWQLEIYQLVVEV